jgi:hypothetical protein
MMLLFGGLAGAE